MYFQSAFVPENKLKTTQQKGNLQKPNNEVVMSLHYL